MRLNPDITVIVKWWKDGKVDITSSIPDKSFASELLRIARHALVNDDKRINMLLPEEGTILPG